MDELVMGVALLSLEAPSDQLTSLLRLGKVIILDKALLALASFRISGNKTRSCAGHGWNLTELCVLHEIFFLLTQH